MVRGAVRFLRVNERWVLRAWVVSLRWWWLMVVIRWFWVVGEWSEKDLMVATAISDSEFVFLS